MRIVAILQARLNSSRLPGKMLLPLLGKPLVQHVIERTLRATKLNDVVLAVPSNDASEFAPIVNGRVWLYASAGDENDLVDRYLLAAQAFHADLVVRIPCDNPCVDPDYIDIAIDQWQKELSPFISNTTAGVRYNDQVMLIDGLGAEVLSLSRLKWLDEATREHPDRSLREHPHKYFCHYDPDADIRLDVNTQADYEFITDIYDHFQRNDFTAAEVVAYLESKKVPA